MRRRLASTRVDAWVVGIDLSLRAAAACALPLRWDHDLRKARTIKAGYGLATDAAPLARVQRFAQIAHDLSVFCVNTQAVRIGIEEYAYGAGNAQAHQTVECGGALKVAILELLGLAVYPVQASSARKILLQQVPRLGRGQTKPWVVRNVKRLGGPTEEWTDDECDAFVVANAVLMHAGGTALTFPGE